jgi:catechol 2,3-dioxygenase-like lactoylglutathione lyase family enzyme
VKYARLVPELAVSDLGKSLEVYVDLFGFEVVYQRPGFAYVDLDGAQLMLTQEPGDPAWSSGEREYPYGRGINLQVEIANSEALRNRLLEANYPIRVDLETNWYRKDDVLLGNREFLVMDPDGYLLRFAQDLGERPEEAG